jgi:hypothetical protein
MSLPVSAVSAALTSIHNENSNSLATLNVDFTLFKLEAPKEFNTVGAIISESRKSDAEGGPLHRTARKLGALFGDLVPSTPALYKAYGARVSEIAQNRTVNPQERRGIFARNFGADSASIWAAATSSTAAIANHLLGCMLARIFPGPEATALWVELVEKRKDQVSESCEQAIYPSECAYTFAASQQVFLRGELGKWDSSARAWLQCSDQAKMLQHDQLKVILNNLTNMPVNDEPRAYESVIKAWISALKAMDCLIRSIPQRAQDGSTLLAMSSTHLYPDMTILDAKVTNVHQKDDLFQQTAILTVGLQLDALPEQSVFWSLLLACLQYYGHPVRATRTAQDSMRLTMDQFERMVLGYVFGKWKDYAADLGSSLFWLQNLSNAVEEPTQRYLSGRGEHGYTQRWSWLSYLCSAAGNMNNLVQLESVESKLAKQQEAFGRRYSSFLCPPRQPAIRLFGLSKLSTILLMVRTVEHRLELLRDIAAQHQTGQRALHYSLSDHWRVWTRHLRIRNCYLQCSFNEKDTYW